MDPIPEVRTVAARALGSLIRGMGEDNFTDLVPWLLETLKSETSSVERSGAAQGLSEVCYRAYSRCLGPPSFWGMDLKLPQSSKAFCLRLFLYIS